MPVPETGSPAPDFTLKNTAKEDVTLSSFKGKPVVLAFYPGAFTGVCKAEMCRLRDDIADFNTVDATVLGISVDSPFANGAFASENGVEFPLLSDVNRTVIEKYGLAFPNFAGIEGYTVSQRAVFVLDREGKVSWSWVAENPGQEPDYDAVKAAVKAAA